MTKYKILIISSIILWIVAFIIATTGAFISSQGFYIGMAIELCIVLLSGIMIAQTVEELIEELDKDNDENNIPVK